LAEEGHGMTIFLILAPYGAFTALMLMASATTSLVAAAVVCAATIGFDRYRGRSLKILAAGSAILFSGIAAWLNLIDPTVSDKAVRLAVDAGVFAISFGSMLARYPFTMQYALESVPAEIAAMPGFIRANYIITSAWTAAALLMMLANAAILYVPGLPIWLGLAVAFAARNSAVFFTKWYSAHRRSRHLAPPANALPKPH
jgi:hypothetical protein